MKKIISIIIVILLSLLFMSQTVEAMNMNIPISIKVNDQYIKSDRDPYIINGTTFVPIRFVAGALNANSIQWIGKTNTAVINYQDKNIILPVNSNKIYINNKEHVLNWKIENKNGRVFVPLRIIAEAMSSQVDWDKSTYTAVIYKSNNRVPNEYIEHRSYTDDDITWLARIVEAESKGEPFDGKLAVANVILNRVLRKDFPNTIYGVIFDDNYGIQFTPVKNGTIYNNPSSYSIIAAKMALEGYNNVGDSIYFLNPVKSTSYWIINNRKLYCSIQNHNFYL